MSQMTFLKTFRTTLNLSCHKYYLDIAIYSKLLVWLSSRLECRQFYEHLVVMLNIQYPYIVGKLSCYVCLIPYNNDAQNDNIRYLDFLSLKYFYLSFRFENVKNCGKLQLHYCKEKVLSTGKFSIWIVSF
jgi:hypothetical protein